MYNLLLSIAISSLAFGLAVLLGFPWVSGVLPAALVFPVVLFLLVRRTGAEVQAALEPLGPMMASLSESRSQAEVKQRMEEVKQLLAQVRDRYKPWQFLVDRQLDAQIGAIDYMAGEFDAALPNLQRHFREWFAECAVGCIHYRRGEHDAAWKCFENAAGYAPKEHRIYAVWAILRSRAGDRAAALEVLGKGLEAVPDQAMLKELKATLANKRRIETERYEDTWFRFFPEDAVQKAMVRGRRGPGPVEGQPGVQMRQGPPQPRLRGKLARRR